MNMVVGHMAAKKAEKEESVTVFSCNLQSMITTSDRIHNIYLNFNKRHRENVEKKYDAINYINIS